MFGLIVKLTTAPGKREEMIGILKQSAADMPGCLSYVIAEDAADENAIWVTEAWIARPVTMPPYRCPAVRNVIPQAKQIALGFDKVAVTNPVWGVGLRSARVR